MAKTKYMSEGDKNQMRELRVKGVSVKEIAKMLGFSLGSVYSVVKDIRVPVTIYHKEIVAGLTKGSILDIETTGLDSIKDEIITVGFLGGNTITVIQRMEASATQFYDMVREELAKLSQPIYVYNLAFEKAFLKAQLGIDLDAIDVFEPWMKRAEAKELKYPKLDDLATVPGHYFGDKSTRGREVPYMWRAYKEKGTATSLALIVRHNMEDLRQTLYVLTFMDVPLGER
jgi:uncharacterized protein YprB with RNaseH-like and TPR domain